MHLTGCSRTSLLEWRQAYRTHGLTVLTDHRLGGNRAKLSAAQWAELQARGVTDFEQALEQN